MVAWTEVKKEAPRASFFIIKELISHRLAGYNLKLLEEKIHEFEQRSTEKTQRLPTYTAQSQKMAY